MRYRVFALLFLLVLSSFMFPPNIATYATHPAPLISGTVTKEGCRVIGGTILTDTTDAEHTHVIELCGYNNKYFKIVHYEICVTAEGSWTDPDSGKHYTFAYQCDVPQLLITERGWKVSRVTDKGEVFKIPYKITNGEVQAIELDPDFFAMIVHLKSDPMNADEIHIAIPRNLLDAKTQDGDEDDFIVLVNGQEANFKEVSRSQCFRALVIHLDAGSTKVEIIAAAVIESPPQKSGVPTIHLVTDKPNYAVGDTLTISGCTNLALDDKEIIVEVLNAAGQMYRRLSIDPNIEGGSFSFSFVIEGEGTINGTYTAKAMYAGHTTTSSFVVPEFPLFALIIFAIAVSFVITRRLDPTLRKNSL